MKRLIALLTAAFLLAACGAPAADDGPPTVLIVNPLGELLADFVGGFTAGMAEQGYVDGETITYTYSPPPAEISPPAIAAVVTDALETSEPDLVVCVSTIACTATKSVLEGTDIPLVFMGVTDPIGAGLVTDFTDIEQTTGIASAARGATNEARAFEWLMRVAPEAERVFIPHNPDDPATHIKLNVHQATAESMGVELVVYEVMNEADLDAALANIPDDIDAIITFPDAILTVPFMQQLNEIAIERGIPHLSFGTQYGQMMAYAPNNVAIGEQAAVLSDRILSGTDVSGVPVEVTEFNLYIYMPTVETMDYPIEDQILRQAVIVREEVR